MIATKQIDGSEFVKTNQYLADLVNIQSNKVKFIKFYDIDDVIIELDGTEDSKYDKIIHKPAMNVPIVLSNGTTKILYMLFDASDFKMEPGTYKIYGYPGHPEKNDGRMDGWGDSGFAPSNRDEYPYYTVTVVKKIDASYYMKNNYPDTYNTMTELPAEIINMDFSNFTDLSYFFAGCSNLKHVPSLRNTYNVKNFEGMFKDCSSLEAVERINTDRATNFKSMFENDVALTNVGMSFSHPITSDTVFATVNMINMFKGCSSLHKLPPIDLANTFNNNDSSGITNMLAGTKLEHIVIYNCSHFGYREELFGIDPTKLKVTYIN